MLALFLSTAEFDDFLASRTTSNPPANTTGGANYSTNLMDPLVPVPSASATSSGTAVPSQDAGLQDLLDFATPAPQAAMQTHNPAPGGRPAMQTHDPNADPFGF